MRRFLRPGLGLVLLATLLTAGAPAQAAPIRVADCRTADANLDRLVALRLFRPTYTVWRLGGEEISIGETTLPGYADYVRGRGELIRACRPAIVNPPRR